MILRKIKVILSKPQSCSAYLSTPFKGLPMLRSSIKTNLITFSPQKKDKTKNPPKTKPKAQITPHHNTHTKPTKQQKKQQFCFPKTHTIGLQRTCSDSKSSAIKR